MKFNSDGACFVKQWDGNVSLNTRDHVNCSTKSKGRFVLYKFKCVVSFLAVLGLTKIVLDSWAQPATSGAFLACAVPLQKEVAEEAR